MPASPLPTATRSERLEFWLFCAVVVVLTLMVIAGAWRMAREQRDVVREHMVLTAQVLARSAQADMAAELLGQATMNTMPDTMGRMGRMGRMHGGPLLDPADRTPPRPNVTDAPNTPEHPGRLQVQVRFEALVHPDGTVVLGDELPASVLNTLPALLEQRSHRLPDALVVATPASMRLSRMCQRFTDTCVPGQPLYAVVGMDDGPFREQLERLRRQAWVVSGFAMCTASLLLAFAVFIQRRRRRERALTDRLAEHEKLAAIGRLAAGAAHEIRNPLSALRGFAQLFAKKFAGQQPEAEYAETMVREADRLNRVITDMLFLAKPDGDKSRLRDVPIGPLLQEVQRLVASEARTQGIELKVVAPDNLTLHADPDALTQALLNLALNGLAFATSRVRLHAEHTPREVVLAVDDDGPGFSPQARKRALEPFFTTRDAGTGLGLALVQRVAEAHGGTVVLGEVGELGGARVELRLPLG